MATVAGCAPDAEVPVRIGPAPLRGSPRDELGDDVRPRRRRQTKPPFQRMPSRSNPVRMPPRQRRGGSRSGSARLVSGSDAGASPACGPGRVAQRTEHLAPNERDAGSIPSGGWARSVMDSTHRFERCRSGFDSSRARFAGTRRGNGEFLDRDSVAETPKYPWLSGSARNDTNGIVEPSGTSRVPSAASGVTRR